MSEKIYGIPVTTPYDPNKIIRKVGFVTPQMYGAIGDGITDDTVAFQEALTSNREVYVPGGTYVLSGELAIEGNCKLSLSQDTVLNFTQTDGNCISLKKLSYLEGNHATINVPYRFNGNVLYATTLEDGGSKHPEPFTQHWTPMWKSGRYITNINIAKIDSYGLHYSDDGVCYGTALYIHTAADEDTTTTYMWGNSFTGLRISGGFSYGVRMVTEKADSVWNNNTVIEGYVEQCEIGCCIEKTNNAVVSLIMQPRAAKDGTRYAKHGVKLIDSSNTDLRNTRVWDWDSTHTLKTGPAEECEYQPYALYGSCKGTFILTNTDTIRCWEETIYSDNIFNLLCTTLISSRGIAQVHPKYAFYKNFTALGYDYTSGHVSWRDGVNLNRYDIPVTLQNPYAYPNRVYKIGSFNFADSDDFPDDGLLEQSLTIEENDRYGLSGWSNLFFNTSTGRTSYTWNPIGRSKNNRVPVYYYSLEGNTYTVYKLIRDQEDIQYVRNCKVSILNSRRFIFEWEDMGDADDIDTSSIIRMEPTYNASGNNNPKLQGMYGYVSGAPVVCTESAVLDGIGMETEPPRVKQLAYAEDVARVEQNVSEQVNSEIGAYFVTDGYEENYTNRIGDYLANVKLLESDGVTQEARTNNIVSGLFSVQANQTVRFRGIRNVNHTGAYRLFMYHKTDGSLRNLLNLQTQSGQQQVGLLEYDADTCTLVWSAIDQYYANNCDFRLSGCLAEGYAMEDVILTIDEEIKSVAVGHLADSMQVTEKSLPDTVLRQADVATEVSKDGEKPVTSKAVYDFVNDMGASGTEGTYELIESITADGSIINRTHEPDGTPYNFKAVFVNLRTPAGVLLSGFNMRTMVGKTTIQAWFDPLSTAKEYEYNTAMWAERKGGLWWWYSKTLNGSSTTNTIKGNVGHFSETAVTQVVTSAVVTAGNILEIWAIRA